MGMQPVNQQVENVRKNQLISSSHQLGSHVENQQISSPHQAIRHSNITKDTQLMGAFHQGRQINFSVLIASSITFLSSF
jgi:hypothetical protein